MMFAPVSGGAMITQGWLFGWAMIPTITVVLALVVALARSGVPASTGSAPAAKLHSGP
jgi:hypothetical protein